MTQAAPGSAYPILPPAKRGYSYPDCYCTNTVGQRVDIGQRACLFINGRSILATCDMSVNNPTWRYSDEACPTA